MKLRKKEIEVPMNFSVSPWRINNLYRGISHFLWGGAKSVPTNDIRITT